jgi:hypothetical protein
MAEIHSGNKFKAQGKGEKGEENIFKKRGGGNLKREALQ